MAKFANAFSGTEYILVPRSHLKEKLKAFQSNHNSHRNQRLRTVVTYTSFVLEWKTGITSTPKHDTLWISHSHWQWGGQYSRWIVVLTRIKVKIVIWKTEFIVKAVLVKTLLIWVFKATGLSWILANCKCSTTALQNKILNIIFYLYNADYTVNMLGIYLISIKSLNLIKSYIIIILLILLILSLNPKGIFLPRLFISYFIWNKIIIKTCCQRTTEAGRTCTISSTKGLFRCLFKTRTWINNPNTRLVLWKFRYHRVIPQVQIIPQKFHHEPWLPHHCKESFFKGMRTGEKNVCFVLGTRSANTEKRRQASLKLLKWSTYFYLLTLYGEYCLTLHLYY